MSNLDRMTPEERKRRPIVRGVLDYFPDAVAEVAYVSLVGNEQHNPGEPMHWAREKSDDHADCAVRHLLDRGGVCPEDGLRHSAKAAWRALANLQIELEEAEPAPPTVKYLRAEGFNQRPMLWRATAGGLKSETVGAELLRNWDEALREEAEKYVERDRPLVDEPMWVYVAGPFSNGGKLAPDSEAANDNVRAAMEIATAIAKLGHYVHCPHAATNFLDGVMPYEYFMQLDLLTIRAVAHYAAKEEGPRAAVYRMNGASAGADREVELAGELGLPVWTDLRRVPRVRPEVLKPWDSPATCPK